MKPTFVVSTRTSILTTAALICAAASANAQGERNLRDPGRMYRDPAANVAAAKSYNLYLTPTYGWDDNTKTFGGQFKYSSDKLIAKHSFSVSAAVSSMRFNGVAGSPAVSKMVTQLGAEMDVLSSKQYSLNVSGGMSRMEDIGTSIELAPEFDWVLPKNSMVTGALGAIYYWDRFSTMATAGNPSVSNDGGTFGAIAYLNRGSWSMIPEYDFNSDYTGEDTFSVKLSKSFKSFKHDPRIFFGYAKHDRFMAGGRWTLR
jgi:hypothetical protein